MLPGNVCKVISEVCSVRMSTVSEKVIHNLFALRSSMKRSNIGLVPSGVNDETWIAFPSVTAIASTEYTSSTMAAAAVR